jgi:hypothetical protein
MHGLDSPYVRPFHPKIHIGVTGSIDSPSRRPIFGRATTLADRKVTALDLTAAASFGVSCCSAFRAGRLDLTAGPEGPRIHLSYTWAPSYSDGARDMVGVV